MIYWQCKAGGEDWLRVCCQVAVQGLCTPKFENMVAETCREMVNQEDLSWSLSWVVDSDDGLQLLIGHGCQDLSCDASRSKSIPYV